MWSQWGKFSQFSVGTPDVRRFGRPANWSVISSSQSVRSECSETFLKQATSQGATTQGSDQLTSTPATGCRWPTLLSCVMFPFFNLCARVSLQQQEQRQWTWHFLGHMINSLWFTQFKKKKKKDLLYKVPASNFNRLETTSVWHSLNSNWTL